MSDADQGRRPATAAWRGPGAAGLSERACRRPRSAGRGARRCAAGLAPGKYALVPTGLTIALPPGYEAQVRPRSGLAAKHGVTVLNCAGHGGRGLSRRDRRAPDQPRRRAVHDPPRRAHRADGDRAGGARGTGSRRRRCPRPTAAAAVSVRPGAKCRQHQRIRFTKNARSTVRSRIFSHTDLRSRSGLLPLDSHGDIVIRFANGG